MKWSTILPATLAASVATVDAFSLQVPFFAPSSKNGDLKSSPLKNPPSVGSTYSKWLFPQGQLSDFLVQSSSSSASNAKIISPKKDWDHVVSSQELDNFQLRVNKIKEPAKLGVDSVQQYTGYLDVKDERKH